MFIFRGSQIELWLILLFQKTLFAYEDLIGNIRGINLLSVFIVYLLSVIIYFQSKVNIASLGVRQVQKRIKSSGFTKTVDIQVSIF